MIILSALTRVGSLTLQSEGVRAQALWRDRLLPVRGRPSSSSTGVPSRLARGATMAVTAPVAIERHILFVSKALHEASERKRE